jgi:hypothetical protein
MHFRIGMEVCSDNVKNLENIDEEVKSDEDITDFELEVKIENLDEKENIKTELFEEKNNSEYLQIIGEKRKNKEKFDFENKKIKEEYVEFVEIDNKQEFQETQSISPGDLTNQVIMIYLIYSTVI